MFRHESNWGVSASRNTAIAHTRGRLIAYLDHHDEYYPNHLVRVWEWRDRGDMLVFRYDQVEERAGMPPDPVPPTQVGPAKPPVVKPATPTETRPEGRRFPLEVLGKS